jgi:hypothetical protein
MLMPINDGDPVRNEFLSSGGIRMSVCHAHIWMLLLFLILAPWLKAGNGEGTTLPHVHVMALTRTTV